MSIIKKPVYLISTVFFLSGCSALIFETLWFRTASIVLGSSIWSAAAVLMAFMSGLGLGNAYMAFRGGRIMHPLRTYIFIELVIGLSSVFAIYLLPTISPIIAKGLAQITNHGSLLNFCRFFIAFVILLFPSIAMGMTIPLLQKFLHNHNYYQQFSRSLGILYGFNTFGAVSGTLLTEFFLIEFLGIRGSGLFACAINLSLAFILLRSFSDSKEPPVTEKQSESINKFLALKSALLPPFLAGFILLALEVIWFRYMLLAHSGTSVDFALMLAIVLAGISLGGFIASRISINKLKLQYLTLFLPLLAAIVLIISFYLFDKVMSHYFLELFGLGAFTLAALVLMLPSCILSGILFTLFGESLYQRLEHTTQATGVLTLTNTMGAALGSGVATFILLPKLGIENSILLLSFGYILIAIFVYRNQQTSKPLSKIYIPVFSTIIILLFCFPFGAMERSYQTFGRMKLPKEKLIAVKEGMNETLQYYQTDRLGKPLFFRLVTNSHSMSCNNFFSKRYMKLYAYFPFIFNREIKDVLQISYGVGSTAEAITNLNSVEHFDVVDISKDILDLSTIIHSDTGNFPLKDKRTEIHLEDGRFFLQTTQRKYDLITGEPPPPKYAGIVNLYTQEYFELIFMRLKSKGMVTYWLPAHDLYAMDSLAIIKAFCLVFKDCSLWNGVGLEFMLVGVKDGIDRISVDKFRNAWHSEIGQELQAIGFESPDMFGTTFMADSKFLKKLTEQVQPVTDNYPHRISPNLKNLRAHTNIYASLLNIERRKQAYLNSEFIHSIFPEEIIRDTLNNFEYEDLMTSISTPLYSNNTLSYWEELSDLLLETDLKILPLLLLNSSPREQSIISQIERDTNNTILETQEYQLAYIKYLLVRREFKQATYRFEKYLLTYKLVGDKDTYIMQLFFLTKALAGNYTAKDFKSVVETDEKQILDKNYIKWFNQRFPDPNNTGLIGRQ